ncbi:DUF3667 domain-containing protein [Flavobacterium sp. 3HN19-14]|uniref:DUF3667 domain-containing protein n=1 Tax=Flavobacterium sp. 3HN19-14 TaxID=3448133 RepID=UPI003EDFF67D
MENKLCLNCSEMASKNFCSNCGQKTDTHRITLKHFVLHDLLHGVWHFERGMLFTIKEIIVRPGKAALDYIKGKRVGYYNIFYLSLLVIAFNALLMHFTKTLNHTNIEVAKKTVGEEFFETYGKAILFSIIPIFSVNSWAIFRRLRLNLAEHMIIAGANLLGMLLITTVFQVFQILLTIDWMPYFITYFQIISVLMVPLFPVWGYRNATKGYYKFWGFSWRIILLYVLILTEWLILIGSTYYLITGQQQLEFN